MAICFVRLDPYDPPGKFRLMPHSKPVITVLVVSGEDQPPGLSPLQDEAQVRLADDEASLRKHLPDSDILLVTDFRTDAFRSAWPVANKLQWVHTTSAGVDAVLFPEIAESNVTITNARGIFDAAIAEYVLGVILAFAKDTRGNIELQQNHKWRHRDTERIAGKQVLVVGAGSIGRQIAKLCAAAGMRVDGIARSAREQDPDFNAVHANTDLHAQLGRADYVVVAAPLTAQTRHMFGADEFSAMQTHARFINIGRGPIVDTDTLVSALQDQQIAGAGLDVFETEPLPADHPLWRLQNVLMSAHMAGDFLGWRKALIEQFLQNLKHWHAGQTLHNIVDKGHG